MNIFCTLFDSFYLSRGLAMYESLKRCNTNFHLYIFAFDDRSLLILKELKLDNVTIISLSEFETRDLLEVKPGRTKAEYCWTSTSSAIEYVLNNYEVQECTYIDADLYFYSSPSALLAELNEEKTVLIFEHRYSPLAKILEEKRAGRFCVQFVTFKNDAESMKILKRWRNQCIDWCYARYEKGKFGDQKYLDEWPVLYNNVKISDNPGGGVAPWNIKQYRINKSDNHISVIEKRTGKCFDLIFYHFHYVRFMENGLFDLGWNTLPGAAINQLYVPYIRTILKIERDLENLFSNYKTLYFRQRFSGLRELIKGIFKNTTKFNIIKLND